MEPIVEIISMSQSTRHRALLIFMMMASGVRGADQPKLAVIQFEVTIDGQNQPAMAKQLTDQLTGRVIQIGRVTVVDDLDVAREMQRLEQELKTGNPESVAPKLGQSLGADQILIPRVVVFGKRITITAKLIDVGKSRTVNVYESEKTGDIEAMNDLLDELVNQMRADPLLGTEVDATMLIPDSVLVFLKRADMAIQRGRTSEALTAVQEAQKQAPENPGVLSRCIGLYNALGKPEEALSSVKAWLMRVGASHPQYDAMLQKEFELTDQLGELKRVAEQAARLVAEFGAAVDRKDADAAEETHDMLRSLSGKHPALQDMDRRLKGMGRDLSARAVARGNFLTLDLGGGVDMRLVHIPAGEFLMGSPESEEHRNKYESPQHKVQISKPFYMGVVEVTNAQYRRFKTDHRPDGSGSPSNDNHPATFISWDSATSFCEWLSKRSGRFIRLPTEAEWEYACRAETTTPYHFGAAITTKQANYNGKVNCLPDGTYDNAGQGEWRSQTTTVGSFPQNDFLLQDMHGNVAEWCADWFGKYKGSDGIDPTGPGSGILRVTRGGGWRDFSCECRSASRDTADSPGSDLGFRVVSPIP